MNYKVTITPLIGDGREITAYEYAIEAYAPHVAVHRAMMQLRYDSPITKGCIGFNIALECPCWRNEGVTP